MTQTDPASWGPNLYAYLETYWAAHGTNANAWSDKHPGIQSATISRWQGGSIPSLPVMQRVADALNVTVLDLLVVAGIVSAADIGRGPSTPPVPATETVLANAADLEPWQRDGLTGLLAAMRDAHSARPKRR